MTFSDLGVTLVSVNYQDSAEAVREFLAELGRSPETIYLLDEDSRTALEFGVIGLPKRPSSSDVTAP